MGYYSNVGILCQRKAFGMLAPALVACTPDTLKEAYNGLVYVEWEDIKWYGDFPEIKRIKRVLEELNFIDDPEESGMAYHMIRIGEDYNDVEEAGNSYTMDIYVNRSIDMPLKSKSVQSGKITQYIEQEAKKYNESVYSYEDQCDECEIDIGNFISVIGA